MKLRVAFFLLFCCFPFCTNAVDLNQDGLHELFLWEGSVDGVVTVFTPDGEETHQIALPGGALEDDPILFKGQIGSTPLVFSLKKTGTDNASLDSVELIAFSPEGRQKRISLGRLKNETVLVTDYDGDGTSDILFSAGNGQVSAIFDPLNSDQPPVELGVRIGNKDRFGLIGSAIARYGLKKSRKIRTYQNGTRSNLGGRVPKNSLMTFLPDVNGISTQFYGTEKVSKSGQITNQFFQANSKKKQRLKTYIPVAPGYYVPTESGLPQIAALNGSRVQYFQVTNVRDEIGSTGLTGTTAPPGGFPTPPGGTDPTGECNNDFPRAELDEAIEAAQDGDFGRFQEIINELNSRNYCQEIRQQITEYFGDNFRSFDLANRSAVLERSYSLVGNTYGSKKAEKLRAGCDKIRTSDGPNGYVLKEGDKDGKIVVLSPGNWNVEDVDFTRLNGKLIEKTTFTGTSNYDRTGARGTHRGKHPPEWYPKKMMVRMKIGSRSFYPPEDPEIWCFQTSNSHTRED